MSDSAIPWTAAHQAPLSMEFTRQECWSGLPFPSPGDFPDPGIEPRSPTLVGGLFTAELPGSFYIGIKKRKLHQSKILIIAYDSLIENNKLLANREIT